MALDELRQFCDEHPKADKKLSVADDDVIVGAKAKADRCFSETLAKLNRVG